MNNKSLKKKVTFKNLEKVTFKSLEKKYSNNLLQNQPIFVKDFSNPDSYDVSESKTIDNSKLQSLINKTLFSTEYNSKTLICKEYIKVKSELDAAEFQYNESNKKRYELYDIYESANEKFNELSHSLKETDIKYIEALEKNKNAHQLLQEINENHYKTYEAYSKVDIALDRFNISELAFESVIAELSEIWKIKDTHLTGLSSP